MAKVQYNWLLLEIYFDQIYVSDGSIGNLGNFEPITENLMSEHNFIRSGKGKSLRDYWSLDSWQLSKFEDGIDWMMSSTQDVIGYFYYH